MGKNKTPQEGKSMGFQPIFDKQLSEIDDIEKLRVISDKLWSLLDDIDTASDMFKPSNEAGYRMFYHYAMRKSEERHKQLQSDGYKLFLPLGENYD